MSEILRLTRKDGEESPIDKTFLRIRSFLIGLGTTFAYIVGLVGYYIALNDDFDNFYRVLMGLAATCAMMGIIEFIAHMLRFRDRYRNLG